MSRRKVFRLVSAAAVVATTLLNCACAGQSLRITREEQAAGLEAVKTEENTDQNGRGRSQGPGAPSVIGYSIFLGTGRNPSARTNALVPIEGMTEEKEAPIDIQVAQAFFQENTLHVRIRLRAKTTVDATVLAVSVAGLREGDVVEEEAMRVSDELQQGQLRSGESIALNFALHESRLTEYQVRCSWGDEGKRFLAQRKAENKSFGEDRQNQAAQIPTLPGSEEAPPQPEIGSIPKQGEVEKALTLESAEIEEQVQACANPPCDIKYTVNAAVKNTSQSAVGGIKLAVGIYWSSGGKLPEIPAAGAPLSPAEEMIDLSGIVVAPEQTRKIRVNVDRAIPIVAGGRFVPHLRLLGYSLSAD